MSSGMLSFIALCALLWIGFHLGAGYLVQRLPLAWIARLPVVGETYGWERSGRIYEPLGIRCWKVYLPDGGGLLEGGFAKRHLKGRERGYLRRFAQETSRAELGHWLTWALALSFFLWTPWWLALIMVLYGGVINVPFILVQRYNRARLQRLLGGNKGR